MWQVRLIKGTMERVYGTYSDERTAQQIAKTHRGTGYWTEVEVRPV